MANVRVTRGVGLLEGVLARKRAAVADRLIPEHLRSGRLLDVGCGFYPYFLVTTRFADRIGVDKTIDPTQASLLQTAGVKLLCHDLEADGQLPMEDASADVVTMLAILEHLELATGRRLLADARRVLRPGGLLVVTTPAAWTDALLRFLARLRLVSPIEIAEHKVAFDRKSLGELLGAMFGPDRVHVGTFELRMNLWAAARR